MALGVGLPLASLSGMKSNLICSISSLKVLGVAILGSAVAATSAQASLRFQNSARKELLNERWVHAEEVLGRAHQKTLLKLAGFPQETDELLKVKIEVSLPTAFKSKAGDVHKAILAESERYGLDPIFLMAVIENESRFNPLARGTSGEIGLMQLLPDTASWIAHRFGLEFRGAKTLENPVQNIQIGAAYLSMLRERFNLDGKLYLAAYNMGVSNVNRALSRNIVPKDYSGRVLKKYFRFYREVAEFVKDLKPSPSDESFQILRSQEQLRVDLQQMIRDMENISKKAKTPRFAMLDKNFVG